MLRKWDRFTMRQNHAELIELDLETWGTCLHLYVLFHNCHEIIFPLALPTAHIRIIVHGWSNIWPLIKHTPFLRTKWYFLLQHFYWIKCYPTTEIVFSICWLGLSSPYILQLFLLMIFFGLCNGWTSDLFLGESLVPTISFAMVCSYWRHLLTIEFLYMLIIVYYQSFTNLKDQGTCQYVLVSLY
jgi:hypothetical protein